MASIRLRDVRAGVQRARDALDTLDAAIGMIEREIAEAGEGILAAREAIVRDEWRKLVDDRTLSALRGTKAPISLMWESGMTTVGAVRRSSDAALQQIRGVGPTKAVAIRHAIDELDRSAVASIRVLPNPDARRRRDTELLTAIDRFAALRRNISPQLDDRRRRRDEIATEVDALAADARRLGMFRGRARRSEVAERAAWLEWALAVAIAETNALQTNASLTAGDPSTVWERFSANTAPFVAVLEAHGGNRVAPPAGPGSALDGNRNPTAGAGSSVAAGESPAATTTARETADLRGGLPAAIADAVEMFDLDRGPLTASLRRYQDFGARYIAHQERSLIGDDMGLGKTVQVLAAMCHLHANGRRHFVVVAPNSVLLNWEREVEKHSELLPYVVHGSQRDKLLRTWGRTGGVAVTTYGTLPALLSTISHIDLLAVDEAHFVKNPKAKRSQAIAELCARSGAVAFLTGTALENRVEELHSLVTTVQPALSEAVAMLRSEMEPDPRLVRERLAPVYLRRTREDVLDELPECVPVEEWIELSPSDRSAYEHVERHIMARRRAAVMGDGTGRSAKFERVRELLEHYEGEGRKVVVFSYFREVLDRIAEITNGCEQINGSITAVERQAVIDRFTSADGFAALAAQIDAGGIGINLQAAQVVIIMEPQFKPSSEAQAIGRVHRQGQSRRVLVHRLLAKDTIEESLVEALRRKGYIFDLYANPSAIKDVSEMAVDGSDLESELRRLLDGWD